jgi:hypothetical protein
VGSGDLQLTINGSNFVNGSVVRWHYAERPTTFVNSTTLLAAIPASDLATVGWVGVTVLNPAPGGGASGPLVFTISDGTETLSADDGTLELISVRDGQIEVVRLTPPRYPARLQAIRVFLGALSDYPDPVGAPIRLIAFAGAPGATRPPDNPRLLLDQSATIPNFTSERFIDFPIANGPAITEGDIYAGFQSNHAKGVFAFFDANGPQSGRSFFSKNNGATYEGPTTATTPQGDTRTVNLMVRAVMAFDDGGAQARAVRVGNASGSPGGQVSVPIELLAQGDENALGFSLTFDPAVLGNPQAALGSGASGATLNANTSQTGSGRLGLALSLPFGQKFGAGARQIVVVNFTIASGASGSSTQVGFGDQPIAREISDVNARALQASYAPGAVSLTSGLEGDVAPRPSGNGSVTITDWVQTGRFVAGQDTPAGGEFQRADTAPRESRGNGSLTITDWVQAGRYAAGLDTPTPAGGPASQSGLGLTAASRQAQAAAAISARAVRVSSGYFERGQQSSVVIELDAQGNENAIGFSLNFDPAQLRFVSAAIGRDAAGATLNVNTNLASEGSVGLALALPAGQTIPAGQRQIIIIFFAVAAEGETATATIGFDDQPVRRELSDADANSLPASFNGGKERRRKI